MNQVEKSIFFHISELFLEVFLLTFNITETRLPITSDILGSHCLYMKLQDFWGQCNILEILS